MIRKNCKNCGQFVWRIPSKLKNRKNIYCCRPCQDEGRKTGSYMNCKECGERFYKNKKSNQEFCSKKCAYKNISERAILNKECPHCGNKFETIKSKNKKYCSRKCMHLASRKGEFRECKECGSEFWTRPSQDNELCSRECSDKYQARARMQKREGKYFTCLVCGDSFYRNRSQIKRGAKTCSMECLGEYKKNGKEFECIECGDIFYRNGAQIEQAKERNGANKFCSNKCQGKNYHRNRKLYPKSQKFRNAIRNKRKREKLHDQYVKKALVGSTPANSTKGIPQQVIDAKRQQLKIYRELKQIKD